MRNAVLVHFDKLASEYEVKYQRVTSILRFEQIRRMQLLLEYAQMIEPGSTLDAGCGPGVVLKELSSRLPGTRFVGADMSYLMLQQAVAKQLAGVEFVQCLVEELPFEDNSFDLLYALGVMDYVDNPSGLFKSVRRVLKPRGYFIFTYPNRDSISRTLHTSLSTHYHRLIGAQRTVSVVPLKTAKINGMVVDNGFELLRCHHITYGNGKLCFPWSVRMSRTMEKWWGHKWVGRYLAWSCFCVARISAS